MSARRIRRWLAAAGAAATAGILAAPAGAAVDHVTLLGVGAAENRLYRVDVRAPSAPLAPVPITGLGAGEVVRAIDYRPANGLLYAVSTSAGDILRTYTVDPTTGAASPVGPQIVVTGVDTAGAVGMSFDPVTDRIRIVNNLASDGAGGNTNNFRVNPDNGARADFPIPDTDLDLTGLPGGNTNAPAVGLAHLVRVGDVNATTFSILSGGDRLTRLGGFNASPSPGTGTLQNVGELGLDTNSAVGFDIDQSDGAAYAVMSLGPAGPRVFTVDLATGATLPTALDNRVGDGSVLFASLALPPRPAVTLSAAAYSAAEGDAATITVTRAGSLAGSSTVRISTRSSAASTAAGTDYAPTSAVLTFVPGQASQNVQVPTVEDTSVEGPETLEVALSGNADADLGSHQVATLTIADDDTAPPPPPTVFDPPTPPLGLISANRQAIDRGITAAFACTQACRANLVLRAGRRVLATRRPTLATPGRRVVSFPLSRAEVALLKRLSAGSRTVALTIRGTFTDSDGSSRASFVLRLG